VDSVDELQLLAQKENDVEAPIPTIAPWFGLRDTVRSSIDVGDVIRQPKKITLAESRPPPIGQTVPIDVS
jgi:hypothetical protein